ncbi:MAG TPA: adenylate/guanylate cyclase domain-containing protein [Gemmatimonadota bacterium]|nr:adenylate/guanylate cyclase domain-containing protein [Gemmatimonadota bacterium]
MALTEMHPVTLRFASAELESAWRADRARRALRPFRATTGLAILLYVGFIVLDRVFLEEVAGRLLIVRAFVCVILLAILASTWTRAWRPLHGWIVAGAVLVAGGGIVTLLAVGRGQASLHWAGIMLALMAGYGLFPPRLVITAAVSLLLIFAFNAVAIPTGILPLAIVVADDFFLVSVAIVGTLATYSRERDSRERFLTTRDLEEERRRSEGLLLNILPEPIARRLKTGEEPIADCHSEVTVLFADIVGFTGMTAGMEPDNLVRLLDRVFHEFDRIASDHQIQKVKTIGDACMMVAGLSGTRDDHAVRIAEAALDMRQRIAECRTPEGEPLRLHIGIASGPVVAGVIGRTRFSYDLWGDVVNTASRMASLGERDRIQVTEEVVRLLAGRYAFRPRGPLEVKGKGTMTTWYLEGREAAAA